MGYTGYAVDCIPHRFVSGEMLRCVEDSLGVVGTQGFISSTASSANSISGGATRVLLLCTHTGLRSRTVKKCELPGRSQPGWNDLETPPWPMRRRAGRAVIRDQARSFSKGGCGPVARIFHGPLTAKPVCVHNSISRVRHRIRIRRRSCGGNLKPCVPTTPRESSTPSKHLSDTNRCGSGRQRRPVYPIALPTKVGITMGTARGRVSGLL